MWYHKATSCSWSLPPSLVSHLQPFRVTAQISRFPLSALVCSELRNHCHLSITSAFTTFRCGTPTLQFHGPALRRLVQSSGVYCAHCDILSWPPVEGTVDAGSVRQHDLTVQILQCFRCIFNLQIQQYLGLVLDTSYAGMVLLTMQERCIKSCPGQNSTFQPCQLCTLIIGRLTRECPLPGVPRPVLQVRLDQCLAVHSLYGKVPSLSVLFSRPWLFYSLIKTFVQGVLSYVVAP